MEIKVTKHAIKRYRERLFDYSSSDDTIIDIMKGIARNGTIVRSRLHNSDSCWEIVHKGVYIVAVKGPNSQIVITCLGDASYRKWLKTIGMPNTLSKRLLRTNTEASYSSF